MKPRWKLVVLAVLTVAIVVSLAGAALAGRAATSASLTTAEEEGLLFLREEEKLARDVYLVLYDEWGATEFNNIATSEARHMASVKTLLDRYGLEDPAGTDTPGVFANADLQAAYYALVAQGSRSLEEAYKVGVAIEEMDIIDLQELIAVSTHRDVTRVAGNLLSGSENHLAAFTTLLAQ